MYPSVSRPVVLTAEDRAVLNEGIGLIFSRWTVMQVAVENRWGGRNSRVKAERTVSNVFYFFTQSKDPMDLQELEEILEDGLIELNTVAEDESLKEVSNILRKLYEECLNGNYQTVEKVLRATSSQTSARVVKVSNGNDEEDEERDEEDEESDDEDEDTCMDNDQTTYIHDGEPETG